MPYAVVRIYTDSGPLVGKITESEAEVRDIMNEVPGFRTYSFLDTGTGAVSVTVCESKAGTDDSIQRAAEWIKANLPDAKIAPPQIHEGEMLWRFQGDGFDTAARPHVVLRVFNAPPPPGIRDKQAEIRELMTAVDGFRAYTVIDTEAGGVTVIAAKDKAATDEIAARMRAFVTEQFPGFPGRNPEVIEADGVFRFEAAGAPA